MLSIPQVRYARKVALKAINKRQQPITYWQAQFDAANRILKGFAAHSGALMPMRTPWKRMNVRSNYFESL